MGRPSGSTGLGQGVVPSAIAYEHFVVLHHVFQQSSRLRVFTTTGSESGSIEVASDITPLVADVHPGRMLFADADQLVSFDAMTGRGSTLAKHLFGGRAGTISLGPQTFAYIAHAGSMLSTPDRVYMADAASGRVIALDRSDPSKPDWTWQVSRAHQVESQVYVGAYDKHTDLLLVNGAAELLYALDGSSGVLRWIARSGPQSIQFQCKPDIVWTGTRAFTLRPAADETLYLIDNALGQVLDRVDGKYFGDNTTLGSRMAIDRTILLPHAEGITAFSLEERDESRAVASCPWPCECIRRWPDGSRR
jgi:outer membrane protein assembly factor BamB